ncbi:MAG TPA: hypothetical protein VHE54_03560 [Puia sp.]|nr:hypothetical protein [Puia sp.]
MFMAPLVAEVLPGATRFSSIFVFPVEMCVWGACALLIRDAVRRYNLGWPGMLLLGLALAVAEECLIQQTSLAPLVIRLKGQTYARAFGVNYVYFLWALIYEPVFVVVVSISTVELIFPRRKQVPWIGKGGLVILLPLLLVGSLFAWYSWTQVARIKVFHLPGYHPPAAAILFATVAMGALIYIAFKMKPPAGKSFQPAAAWLLGISGAVWAFILYGLVLLGFGIDPAFPEWIAIGGAIVILVILPVAILPKFLRHSGWTGRHQFGLTCGTIIGSMAAGQIGFIGATGPDMYFKIITNILTIFLLTLLGFRQNKRTNFA